MSDEERERILGEARATLDRLSDMEPAPLDPFKGPDWTQREPPAPQPVRREHKLDTAPIDWDARIAAAVAQERKYLLDVLGGVLTELMQREHANAKGDLADEVRSLRLELTELATTVAELRRTLATERAADAGEPVLTCAQVN